MKVKINGVKKVVIRGEYIKLDSLLKFAGAVSTGGEAKYLITGGKVSVNGVVSKARGHKVRGGDVVRCGAGIYKIVCAGGEDNDR